MINDKKVEGYNLYALGAQKDFKLTDFKILKC